MKDFAIYVDMDGVLADYDGGIRAMGFDIDPRMKNKLNKSGTGNPLKRQMHEAIKGTQFYRDLPILPGALSLWKAIEKAEPIVLTASPKFGATEDDYYLNPHWLGAAYHKRGWMEDTFLPQVMGPTYMTFKGAVRRTIPTHIPLEDERFICTTSARKYQFMHRKKSDHQILIDDRVANCQAWAKAGGFAIVHDGNVKRTLNHLDWYILNLAKLPEIGHHGIIAGLPSNTYNQEIT